MIHFSWDRSKEAENVEKHGFGFDLARLVFDDPDAVYRNDDYPDENRQQAIGTAGGVVLLLVVHTEHYGDGDDSYIRIISARTVERAERRLYQRGYA